MVELLDRTVEAAWKIGNLPDFEARLERAAERVDAHVERRPAAFVIYESALMKSGRSREDIRALISDFDETFADPEEEYTIPRVSGVMNAYGDEWFFGNSELRLLTGQLLGQFQHRVAQYNYVPEAEVLKRWADSYDTRLFIRRRIYDTEPVVGVVAGFDLAQMQYLRVVAGGDTLVPTDGVAKALASLGFDAPANGSADGYETLARAEGVALQLEIPSPLVGEILEELAREDFTDYPEPPAPEPEGSESEEESSEESGEEKPGPEAREARRAAKEDPEKGDEPTRVQDPQSKDAPGVPEEAEGEATGDRPAVPEDGKEGGSGAGAGGEENVEGRK